MYTLPPISMVQWKMMKNKISNSWLANTAIFHLTLIRGEYVEQFLFVLHTPVQDMLICIYTHIQYVYRYIRLPLSLSIHIRVHMINISIHHGWIAQPVAVFSSFFQGPLVSGDYGTFIGIHPHLVVKRRVYRARPHLVTRLVWPLWWSN